MDAFLADEIATYADRHNRLAGGTSVLSPHLHFGTVSARELEARVLAGGGQGEGRQAFRRQLGWRDFYAHVLLHFPENAKGAFNARFDSLEWTPTTSGSRRGRRAGPAIRSSTPACGSCGRSGGCTTAPAWSSAPS